MKFLLIACLPAILLASPFEPPKEDAQKAPLTQTTTFQIGIAAIFHNDAKFLTEWIDYHLKIGVDHFWLYNDCSDDSWEEVLEPYIEQGLVEVFDWSSVREQIQHWPQIQIEAYKNAIERARGKTKWLALIDTDEFILIKKKQKLPTCLNKYYNEADAIYIQWLLFGTSRLNLSPKDSLLTNLTLCAQWSHPWNSIGKTIVRPEKADFEKIWNVHHLPLISHGKWFNGSGKKISMVNNDLFFNYHKGDLIRINHYFFRDEQFFREVKIPRKLKRGMSLQELFQLYEDSNQSKNTDMIPRLSWLCTPST